MPILKIKDTEAVNADILRNLYNLDSLDNTININYITLTSEYLNEGVVPILSEQVEITFPSSFNQDRVLSIVEQMSGFSLLTHKTSLNTPDQDMDENTFNYNNYATDAFSYYNIRNEEYEDYTQANDERLLPNFCLGALWTRPGNSLNQEQRNYYTMFDKIPTLLFSDILAGSTPINNYEFDDEFIAYGNYFNLEMKNIKDYYKNMLLNGENARPEYR